MPRTGCFLCLEYSLACKQLTQIIPFYSSVHSSPSLKCHLNKEVFAGHFPKMGLPAYSFFSYSASCFFIAFVTTWCIYVFLCLFPSPPPFKVISERRDSACSVITESIGPEIGPHTSKCLINICSVNQWMNTKWILMPEKKPWLTF